MDEDKAARAREMRDLSPEERTNLIVYGILAGKVIDIRPLFWARNVRLCTDDCA